jgi:hypothetical protein
VGASQRSAPRAESGDPARNSVVYLFNSETPLAVDSFCLSKLNELMVDAAILATEVLPALQVAFITDAQPALAMGALC